MPEQVGDPFFQFRPFRVVFFEEPAHVDAPGRGEAETEELVDLLLLSTHPVLPDRVRVHPHDARFSLLVPLPHDQGGLVVDLLSIRFPCAREITPHGEGAPLVRDPLRRPRPGEVLQLHFHAGESRRIVQADALLVEAGDADEMINPSQVPAVRVVRQVAHIQRPRHHRAIGQHPLKPPPGVIGAGPLRLLGIEVLAFEPEDAQAVADGNIRMTVVEEDQRVLRVALHDARAIAHHHQRLQMLGAETETV